MFKKPQHRTALVALTACAGVVLSGGQVLAGHRTASCGFASTNVPYRTAHYQPAYVDAVTYAAPVVEYIEPTYVVPAYATTSRVRYLSHGRRHYRPHHYYERPYSTRDVYRGHHDYRSHRRGRSLSIRIGASLGRHHGHRNHGGSFRHRR